VEKQGKRRLPHHITLRNEAIYALAAIWEPPIVTGRMANAFSVVTTEANELVRPLHDRMPVIIYRDAWPTWLDSSCALEDAEALLRPYPAEKMELVAVSEFVNSATHEGPECLAPVVADRTLFD
jgi:putative SOS response-associated peptidase YedK